MQSEMANTMPKLFKMRLSVNQKISARYCTVNIRFIDGYVLQHIQLAMSKCSTIFMQFILYKQCKKHFNNVNMTAFAVVQ